MSVLSEDFVLANAVTIPKLGFGTWKIPNEIAPQAVVDAIEAGYRHIDTARVYRNEIGVGQGLHDSGVARDQVFVTTKVPSSLKTFDEVAECIDESLRRLDTNYIDLLLIHGPKPWPPQPGDDEKTYFDENVVVWTAMQQAYKDGKLRAIGVSNFEIPDLENLLTRCEIAPMANQIEVRIGFPESELVAYCQAHNIVVEAYSPLGTGALLGNDQIAAVAEKYGVTVPQICIRYTLQKGCLSLPKSVHRDFIVANTQVDFEISDEDMATLDAIPDEPAE